MNKNGDMSVSEVWKNILVAVVSFLLAIVGQQYYFEKQNEIQRIDVHTSFDSDYISKPKFPDSKVEITVDGNTKESIGLLEVSLINFSSKVFTDVPLLIEIRPKKTGAFSYLSHFAHGEKGMKDLVVETKGYEYDNGVHRFSYKAKSLNRSEDADISMKLGVLFEGEEQPDVIVSAVGLSTREFNSENSPSRAKVKRDAFLLLIGILFALFLVTFIMVGPLISRLASPLDRKNNKRYAKELFDVLRLEPLHQSMTDDDLRNHVATVLYKRQIIWWNSKSLLGKWSLGMREPQPGDYQI